MPHSSIDPHSCVHWEVQYIVDGSARKIFITLTMLCLEWPLIEGVGPSVLENVQASADAVGRVNEAPLVNDSMINLDGV